MEKIEKTNKSSDPLHSTIKPTISKDRHKYSRRRLDQVNAAAKRCRQRQKDELQYLRVRVKELEEKLKVLELEESANDMKILSRFLSEFPLEINDLEPRETKKKSSRFLSEFPLEINNLEPRETKKKSSRFLSEFPLEINNLEPRETKKKSSKSHEDLFFLVHYLQTQATIAKNHVHCQFANVPIVNIDGYLIKSVYSSLAASYYITKFYPFVHMETIRKAFYILATEDCNSKRNIVEQEHIPVGKSVMIMREVELSDYALMTYGKAEVEMKVLCSVYREGEDEMFSICSPFPRSVSDKGSPVKKNCSGWVQFRRHVQNNSPGVLICRYCNIFYDNGMDGNGLVTENQFAEHMLNAVVLLLREFDSALAKAPRARLCGPLGDVLNVLKEDSEN